MTKRELAQQIDDALQHCSCLQTRTRLSLLLAGLRKDIEAGVHDDFCEVCVAKGRDEAIAESTTERNALRNEAMRLNQVRSDVAWRVDAIRGVILDTQPYEVAQRLANVAVRIGEVNQILDTETARAYDSLIARFKS